MWIEVDRRRDATDGPERILIWMNTDDWRMYSTVSLEVSEARSLHDMLGQSLAGAGEDAGGVCAWCGKGSDRLYRQTLTCAGTNGAVEHRGFGLCKDCASELGAFVGERRAAARREGERWATAYA